MRLIPRVLIVLVMFSFMFLLIRHTKELEQYVKELENSGGEQTEWVAEESELDSVRSKLATYQLGILAMAVATALVSCIALLPLLGELAGNFIFSPNQKIERSPHADALAKLAAGDFQGAIDEYRKVFDDDPQDVHAASEIVRLYCEKLNEPEPASDFLVEALSYTDRSPEESAFLSQRLVDVCWNYQKDGIRARAILIKIAEDMPETREAANAMHRLQEIEKGINEQAFMSEEPSVAQAVSQQIVTPPAVDKTPEA